MKFLYATTHVPPGDTFVADGMNNPTNWYIARANENDPEAIALLAQAGIVPHHMLDNNDDRILGIKWELQADGWHEVASGTPEAIAAALAQQHIDSMRSIVWRPAAARRRLKAAKSSAIRAAATLPPASRAAVKALLTLTEAR